MKSISYVLVCLMLILVTGAAARADLYDLPEPADESTIDSLNELAFKVKRNDLNRALVLLSDALNLSVRTKYRKGEATAYLYEAGIYKQNGYGKKALSLYYKSLGISRHNKDTFNIARANHQIASALIDAGELAEAEKLYKQALQGYVSLKREEEVVNLYNSLGLLKLKQQETPAAKIYFYNALQESEQIGYEYGFKKAHFHLGLLFLREGDFPKSEDYFNKAISLDTQNNDKYGLALSKNQLAVIHFKKGDHLKALRLAEESLHNAQLIAAQQLEIEAIGSILDIYRKQKNLPQVIEWQNALIKVQQEQGEKEKTYAVNFLDIIKEKQMEQLQYEKQALLAEQNARITNYVLLAVSLVLAFLGIIAPLWYKSYLKIKAYSQELMAKNEVIEKNAQALGELHQAVSLQNESLEEANKMKDKLLSIISHDLRAPLMNTKGVLQIINSGVLTEAESKVSLIELEKQYTRSVALLDNMLFWIKSQMQGDRIERRPLQVRTLLQGVIEEQEIASKMKGITVQNEVDANLVVLGDKEMLKVVFRNLLSNALKFTRKNGLVHLISGYDNMAMISFKDEGIGMSQEILEKVRGKKYFTTKGTNNEAGSGFGLMICADLISKNGGELLIESKPNQGSTFTVKLAVSETPVKQSASLGQMELVSQE